MPESVASASCEIVLLSGHDLRRLLHPKVVIEALREAYAALADNRGDQGRSVGFMIEGGSIHVKSGLLPGSHLAFASKVNVNLPDNWKVRRLPIAASPLSTPGDAVGGFQKASRWTRYPTIHPTIITSVLY